MDQFSRDSLLDLISQKILLTDGDGNRVDLTVKEVVPGKLDGDEWDSFSVRLEGDESFHVPQGSYQLSHERIGSHTLFMSPNSATEYEIIVNRKRS